MKITKLFLSGEAGVVGIVLSLVVILIAAGLLSAEWIKGAPDYLTDLYLSQNAILSEWLGGEMTRGNWFFIVAMLPWLLSRK